MANYTLTHTGSELDEAIERVLDGYIDTSAATAVSGDIVSGKTAFARGSRITGTHICDTPELQTKSVSPSDSEQTVTGHTTSQTLRRWSSTSPAEAARSATCTQEKRLLLPLLTVICGSIPPTRVAYRARTRRATRRCCPRRRLSHTKWNCKYHIVFAPKYRRKVFYGEKRMAVGKILRQLCEWKGVKIVEAEVCPDHVHMLVEIPPKLAVSSFMGYLKGKSSTMLYEQFGELKYKYRSREFWCKGYYVDTAGKNASRIAEYIKNQLKEDEMGEQLTMSEVGPFTGGK